MSDAFLEASTGELEPGFPRFLNRDRPDVPLHLLPPPLPFTPWWRRVATVPFGVAGATTLCAIAIASAPVVTVKRASVATDVAQPAVSEMRNDVAEAVDIVAPFESRLSFGANLPAQTPDADSVANHNSENRASAGSDAIAGFMKHVETGSDAAAAASTDGQSVLVSAKRDDNSDARSMVLSRDGAEKQTAAAEAGDASRTALRLGEEQVRHILKGHAAESSATKTPAVEKVNDEEAAVKTVKRRHSLHVRKVVTVAQDETLPKRRVRRSDDAFKARNAQPPLDGKDDVKTAGQEPEQPAGPLSKFIAWLKSGAKKPSIDDEKPTGLGLAPQN